MNDLDTRYPARPFMALVALFVALATMATACSSGSTSDDTQGAGSSGPESGDPGRNDQGDSRDLQTGDVVLTSGLQTIGSCDDLLDRLRSEGTERVGAYGFGDGLWGIDTIEDRALDEATDAFDTTAEASMADSADSADAGYGETEGASNYSGTNNQETLVDEADMVKTDRRRLVTVTQGRMQVIDVGADTPGLETTIELPDGIWGGELFLFDDRALIMTTGWTDRPFTIEATADISWFPGSPTGRLIEVDLDRGEVSRTLEFEGSYLSAREIGDTVRIALTASASRFEFLYPSNPGAEDQAEKFNRQLVAESTIDQWIPTYRVIDGPPVEGSNDNVVESGPIVDCDRVHLPEDFAGFGSLVVLTADLSDGLRLKDSLSVFTDASTVYASTDRLAVATPRWPTTDLETGLPDEDGSYSTAIHTFDITNTDRADYVASGDVDGYLLNQYSLSEYDGHLRVATTMGGPWGFNGEEDGSESMVTVLDEQDGELVSVGQVGNLGLGEQIQAVRFMGDRGYVVTFRQIDPLYTLDLSDPTNPTVEGELKIPGFSSYLHPLDEGLLMGVGMDGDESGNLSGAAVSLFDVSDPANPTLLDKLRLADLSVDGGESDSYSPVNGDARAFTWWDETAIVPVTWWKYNFAPQGGNDQDGIDQDGSDQNGADQISVARELNGSEAVMIRVEDGLLSEVGRVAHPHLEECESAEGMVSRYVELDDQGRVIGELADTVSDRPEPADPDSGSGSGSEIGLDPDAQEETTTTVRSGDAEAEFVEPDSEDMPAAEGLTPGNPGEPYCWVHSPEIMRTIVVDDKLFTVSFDGVGVHNFTTGSSITWIPFERL